MKLLPRANLKTKVPAVITILCIVTAIVVGLNSYIQFRATILHSQSERFQEALHGQTTALNRWVDDLEKRIATQSASPFVAEAIAKFSDSWSNLGDSPQNVLQDLYIHRNPHPTGEKHNLLRAADSSYYSLMHEKYHPFFVDMLDRYHYYDIFLFDPNGNMIYSTYKELDYATNFMNGVYADSGLGIAYRRARQASVGAVIFEDYSPYAPSADAPASFVSSPVYSASGDIVGVFAIQFSSAEVQGLIRQSDISSIDRVIIVGQDGLLRSRVEGVDELSILDQANFSAGIKSALDSNLEFVDDAMGIAGYPVMAALETVQILGAEWFLLAEGSRATILAPLHEMQVLMLIGGLAVVIVITLIGLWLSRAITKPIGALNRNMLDLIDHQYDQQVFGLDRGDEFGSIARSIDCLRDSLRSAADLDAEAKRKALEQNEVVEKLTGALLELSEGNLTCELREPFSRELEPVRENFNNSLRNLSMLVHEVIKSCQSISSESTEISQGADNLSNRTENQAATLEETAAALDQLTSGVRQAAESAKEAEGIVDETKENARSGKSIVDEAITAMLNIEESSNQASEIIGVIDEIAFQTNLLALNAGVEAGRAGEAGRGFAVVASEVGSLAQRSSDAAKEIKKLIADSARQVSKGVEDVTVAGKAMTSIVDRVNHISDLMKDVASSALEQSHSLDEINIGVNQLDQVTQQNAAMVEQSTAASHQLNNKAEELRKLVGQFRIEQMKSSVGLNSRDSYEDWEEDRTEESNEQPFKSQRSGSGAHALEANATDPMWQNF